MSKTRVCFVVTVTSIAMLGALSHSTQAKGGQTTPTATLEAGTIETPFQISPGVGGPYGGSIDRGGNFSFNLAGTTRSICFDFDFHGGPIPLLDPPRISDATPPESGCYAASFTTFADASGRGLMAIPLSATELRGVRFNWANPNVDDPTDPANYILGFRGDRDSDGATETSLVKATCTDADPAGCRAWTLEPCAASDIDCPEGAYAVTDEGMAIEGPVGRVGGGFPKGKGTTEIARYVLAWRMSIVR